MMELNEAEMEKLTFLQRGWRDPGDAQAGVPAKAHVIRRLIDQAFQAMQHPATDRRRSRGKG